MIWYYAYDDAGSGDDHVVVDDDDDDDHIYHYSDNYRFSPQQTSGPGCEVACVKSVPIRISSMRTFESDTLKSLEWKLKKMIDTQKKPCLWIYRPLLWFQLNCP